MDMMRGRRRVGNKWRGIKAPSGTWRPDRSLAAACRLHDNAPRRRGRAFNGCERRHRDSCPRRRSPRLSAAAGTAVEDRRRRIEVLLAVHVGLKQVVLKWLKGVGGQATYTADDPKSRHQTMSRPRPSPIVISASGPRSESRIENCCGCGRTRSIPRDTILGVS